MDNTNKPTTKMDTENTIPREELWHEDLLRVFGTHIDKNGWLTENWAAIIEAEVPRFDEHYADNPDYENTYSRMYNTDFEYSKDGEFIRPLP